MDDDASFAAGRGPGTGLASTFSLSPPRDIPHQVSRVAGDHGRRESQSALRQPEGTLYDSMLSSSYPPPPYTYRYSEMDASQQQQQFHTSGVSPYLMPQPHQQQRSYPYPTPISPSARPGWTGPKLKSNGPGSASSWSSSLKPPQSHIASFSASPDAGPGPGPPPTTASSRSEANEPRRPTAVSASPSHDGPGGGFLTFPAYQPSAGGPVLSNMHRPGGPVALVGPGGLPFPGPMGSPLAHPAAAAARHAAAIPANGPVHIPVPVPAFGVRAMTAAAADALARPFRCERCPQSFNRRHDMRRHERIHLTIKPFPCKSCEKTFSRKDALKRHLMVRECGKKPENAPGFVAAVNAATADAPPGTTTSNPDEAEDEYEDGDDEDMNDSEEGPGGRSR